MYLPAIPGQAFWLLCAGFYLWDCVRIHSRRELFLIGHLSGHWNLSLPLTNFQILGKAVTILNPFLPFTAALVLRWTQRFSNPCHKARRAETLLLKVSQGLWPLRLVAGTALVIFFILGPAITYKSGLGIALVSIAPLYIILLMSLAVVLVRTRQTWRMSLKGASLLWFECAVCPGYLINICRRTTLQYRTNLGDPVAIELGHDDPLRRAKFAADYESMVSDLRHFCTLDSYEEEILSDQQAWVALRAEL